MNEPQVREVSLGSGEPAAENPRHPARASALLPSQRMRVAYVLAVVGGYLDAYTYFKRGGVFANAQTGNIVKLGIALAEGGGPAIVRYLLPIGAFVAGLIASLAIEEVLERRGLRLVRRSVLVAEAATLGAVGLVPLGEDWDVIANCLVSFAAAMQYETFQTFRGQAIVTTMSTGNLRKFVDNLFAGVVGREPGRLRDAGVYLSVICAFAGGAFLGTICCEVMGRGAVVPAMAGLMLAAAIITWLRRKNGMGVRA